MKSGKIVGLFLILTIGNSFQLEVNEEDLKQAINVFLGQLGIPSGQHVIMDENQSPDLSSFLYWQGQARENQVNKRGFKKFKLLPGQKGGSTLRIMKKGIGKNPQSFKSMRIMRRGFSNGLLSKGPGFMDTLRVMRKRETSHENTDDMTDILDNLRVMKRDTKKIEAKSGTQDFLDNLRVMRKREAPRSSGNTQNNDGPLVHPVDYDSLRIMKKRNIP